MDYRKIEKSIYPTNSEPLSVAQRKPCEFCCFSNVSGCPKCHFTGYTIVWVDDPYMLKSLSHK